MITENQSPLKSLPVIAIIGRPNVGKSSLFNCLIGKRIAVTYKKAGTTRDRIYHSLILNGIKMILVDTGGMEYGKKENIEADIQTQARIALQEADLILFVLDASEELTKNDYETVNILRKSNKDIIVIGNKADHSFAVANTSLLEIGFGEPIKVSTIHKTGLGELEEEMVKKLKNVGFQKIKNAEEEDIELNNLKSDSDLLPQEQNRRLKNNNIKIAFIGRPNAGKSSLINAIIGKEKLIVSDIAGTTRDAIDTPFKWQKNACILIDTAGLRRRGKIIPGLEKLSAFRALEAIERTDIVCLLLDYEQGVGTQDLHLASYALDAKKGLMLVVNKCDLMKETEKEKEIFIRKLKARFDFLPWAPVVFVSALKKINLNKMFELIVDIFHERQKWLDKDELDGFMKEIIYKHVPPKVFERVPKFYSLQQDGINPPTFVFQLNDRRSLHFSYRRYLENEIRKKYGFVGTAIRLIFKEKREK